MVLRAKEENVFKDFFPFFLQSDLFIERALDISVGSLSPTINWKTLKTQEFPLPPLEEQKRIAEVLWGVEDSIRKTENAIGVAERYKKMLMKHLFTYGPVGINEIDKIEMKDSKIGNIPKHWQLETLEKITVPKIGVKRGPWGSSVRIDMFVDAGFKIYEQQNVIKNDFTIGQYYIDEKKFSELHQFSIIPGDILITAAGTIGEMAVVPDDAENGIINQALLRLRINQDEILKPFFIIFLKTTTSSRMFVGASQGSALKNLCSVKILKKLSVPLPPKGEQEKIIYIYNSLESNIQQLSSHFEESKLLKTRLINTFINCGTISRGESDV